ncbi:MAG: anchored repeat-type ABC transporter permease subunit [Actinomyces sp.]|uniref:anchored repeat-type ABC transporter permease subunit n=1 Tax=Actinomyces sp. HMSC075B09 TaxID=1739358 RepID=UPI0008A25C19|nr:anchored repeat-type ABC transporter permease subunit [Actinomyces sp. HMSC075B09]MBS6102174.1 anchored repeat-type ABC transporter permease subunit [Actinomyces sp.]MDU4287783.1 anchored repeat-type ABC transporter permease subunit [Actinomyces sp.]OFJ61636.1 ABC transporter ATP-binding protein [Actinomyces sp. HMSC075B09]
MNPIEFLADLANPQLAFLSRALLMAILSAVLCGIVGSHIVVRGLSFVGDALSHAVFPGIAVAFATGTSTLLGGAIAGVIVALLIALFSRRKTVGEDSIIGILFAAAFSVGLVIVSRMPTYTGSLESLLFGSLTGVTGADLLTVAISGALVLTVLVIFHRGIVAVSFDREYAQTLGYRAGLIDVVLYVATALAVVVSVSTVGNILVLALLVGPPATARLLTRRISAMMALSAMLGTLAALVGLWVSWSWSVPTGAALVLAITAEFILVWIFQSLHAVRTSLKTIQKRLTKSINAKKKSEAVAR